MELSWKSQKNIVPFRHQTRFDCKNIYNLHDLELDAAVTADAADTEVVASTAARTPPSTRAGGQDDGSLTNSLKLYINNIIT